MLHIGIAAVVVGIATMIMVDMDASSKSQGGRFYVALAAVVALGALDKLAGSRREDALLSLGVLVIAAMVLIGLALTLP